MKKILAAVLGGLIAFVWSAVVHMTPGVGSMGLSTMGPKEDAVIAAMKSSGIEKGLYFYPGMDRSGKTTKAEEDAWLEKFKTHPHGLLLYHPPDGVAMGPKPAELGTEFASSVVGALIAVCILGSLGGSNLSRALKVSLLGLFGWIALSISHWNWYGYPFAFIMVDFLDQTIGWFLAGLVMAKMIKPAASPAPPA